MSDQEAEPAGVLIALAIVLLEYIEKLIGAGTSLDISTAKLLLQKALAEMKDELHA